MHKFVVVLFSAMLSTSVLAAEPITLEVEDIQLDRAGNLMVLVFAGEGFPIKHEQAIEVQVQRVVGKAMVFEFTDLPIEELAFKVLHDEDENNRVTKDWLGIWPVEGLGFSNGAEMGRFGPPDFEAAKLTQEQIAEGVLVKIKYP